MSGSEPFAKQKTSDSRVEQIKDDLPRAMGTTNTTDRKLRWTILALAGAAVATIIGSLYGIWYLANHDPTSGEEDKLFPSMMAELARNAFYARRVQCLDDAWPCLFMAEKDKFEHNYESAHANFTQALTDLQAGMPGSKYLAFVTFYVASFEYDSKKWGVAESLLRESLSCFEKSKTPLSSYSKVKLSLIGVLVNLRKNKEAVDLGRQTLCEAQVIDKGKETKARHTLEALDYLAYALQNDNRYQESLQTYTNLLELLSKQQQKSSGDFYARIFVSMARDESLLRDYTRALADCDKAISYEPNYAYAYSARASFNRYLKKTDAELNDLNKSLELEPASAWALVQRADCFEQMQHSDKAIEDLTKAINLDPEDDNGALYKRAVLYASLHQYTSALDDFSASIEKNNPDKLPATNTYRRGYARYNRVAALTHRADVYKAISKPDLERKDREELLVLLAPTHPKIMHLQKLPYLLSKKGKN
jgi:tetratricopeptide (TPR) repeat protein